MRNISGLCFLLSLLRFIPAFGGNDTHSLSSPAEEGEWRMYVCRGDSCHSFEVQNVDEVTFHPDSFHVERWWQYAYNETDSIVFRQPNLMTTEMGWWGDIRNGESCYLAHPYKDLFETTFEVCYRVTAQNGVCLSVNLELTFAEEWMAEEFLVFPTGEGDGDPYIYVKNTQTGPRKFEVWIMNNLVIPFDIPLEGDGCVLSADCSDLLAGRDMVEVKTIIEAWVQQPPELIEEKVVNIENEKAKAYLKTRYNNGDYSYTKFPYQSGGITSSNVDITLPNGAVIDTPLDENATTRHLEYADNPRFSQSKVVNLDIVSSQYTIQNLEGDKSYYWRVYKDSSAENLLASGSFRTEGHLRQIRIPANSNFNMPYIKNVRDIGGWQTEGGKRLRYRVLFRGSELNHDNDGTIVSYISQEGTDVLTELGVSAELDLRGGIFSESALGQDVAYANIPADLFFYRLNIYNTITKKTAAFVNAIRQIVTWIKAGKVIYVHCAGGCDRTGFLCAAIEGICGVSENDINLDYELSIRNRNREYYLISKGDNYDGDFKFAMEYIKGLLEYNGHIYVYYRGSYYDAQAHVSGNNPVALTDATLLTALGNLSFGTLKERFHRLMKVGGMTEREMEELEMLLCS